MFGTKSQRSLNWVFLFAALSAMSASASFAMGKHEPDPDPTPTLSPSPEPSVIPKTPCEKPAPDASILFDMIANPKTQVAEVTTFINTHLVAWDAYNDQCDTTFLSSLENKRYDIFQALYEHYLPDPSSSQPGIDGRSIYSFILTSEDLPALKILKQEAATHHQTLSLAPVYDNSKTELLLATEGNPNVEMIQYLLQSGNDVNAQDSLSGYTPLLNITQNSNDVEVVKTLLQAGANVNYATPKEGMTPLQNAVSHPKSSADEIRALIQAGANVNATTTETWAVLDDAAEKCNVDIIRILLQAGAKVTGLSLMRASTTNNLEVIEALIQAGADVKGADSSKQTALMFAASKNKVSVIRALIDAGSDVNAASDEGMTAMMFAASNNTIDVVQALIQAGANVNAASGKVFDFGSISFQSGVTPLMLAAGNNTAEVVRALIQAGASVNATAGSGATALMNASLPRPGGVYQVPVQLEIITTLLQAGADPSKRINSLSENEGQSAADIAKYYGAPQEIFKLLGGKSTDEN